MPKYIGSDVILTKQISNILTENFNFPISHHRQYRVVIKCSGYKDAQAIAEKYNIPASSFNSNYASVTGNEDEIQALQNTELIILPLYGKQVIVTIEQLMHTKLCKQQHVFLNY